MVEHSTLVLDGSAFGVLGDTDDLLVWVWFIEFRGNCCSTAFMRYHDIYRNETSDTTSQQHLGATQRFYDNGAYRTWKNFSFGSLARWEVGKKVCMD